MWPARMEPVAPWWHTAMVVAVILGVSVLNSGASNASGLGRDHIKHYSMTIVWEWALAGLTWWGIRLRHVPLRQVLGERRAGAKAWLEDFGAAMIFWLMSTVVLAAVAMTLRLLRLMQAQKVVLAIAPRNVWEAALWIALSITAGVVEEFVFRGYLLQQFSAVSSKLSIRNRLWVGVLISSLLFGAAHGYEGIGAMIAITLYGAMFAALTIQRRSLRAGMMAHAWHDAFTGIALAIAKHLRLI
jgi:uncharacterized protein